MRKRFPGFYDLQVNGFAGVDFNQPENTPDDVRRAADALTATGVTRFLTALITSSPADFARCAKAVLAAAHPAVAGIHLEGPYINPANGPRGAHPREYVIPALLGDFLRRQEAAGGRIALVTLAPESPGALHFIEALVAAGIRVAIGHTAASAGQIGDAIRAGATLSTHLGNGCESVMPRHPNVLWEQLAADELTASLIVDGHHLPPSTVKAMIRAKTPARTVLVTDAMAAAGSPPGRYTLGRMVVERDAAGRVAPPGTSHLAGSSLTMPEAVSNTVRFSGLPLEEVLPMAAARPAALLGRQPAGWVTAEWDPATCALSVVAVEAGDAVIADEA
jgi:N-acetylglucosamine-6-phosphate deacetylase